MTKKPPLRVVAAVLFVAAIFANSAKQAGAANPAASPQSAPDRALAVHPVATAASLGSTEKNWLVAIGVNQFKDKSVQALRFCVADAQSLYDFFTSTGFVPQTQAYLLVTGADDPDRVPTRVNILAAIKYVASRAGEDSTVIVHFSGHGFDDAKGASYLLPEDGKRSLLEDTAVSVARVNELLAGAKTKRKILIVDACRSETTGRGGETAAASEAFIQALRASSGQVTMASCGKGEISYEMPEGGHGAYTHFLLAGLKGAAEANGAGLITLSGLQDYVARAVPGWCSQQMKEKIQQPWMSGEMSLPIPLAVKVLGVPPSGGPLGASGSSGSGLNGPPEGGTPNTPAPPQPLRPQPPTSGERFTVASNGVITDWQQNLDWYVGRDQDTNYDAAVSWVRGLSVDGGGWRMPTREELKTLYEKGLGDRNMNPVFKTTGWWVWAEERDSSSAWFFGFYNGNEIWDDRII